jgi:hypothetical protein
VKKSTPPPSVRRPPEASPDSSVRDSSVTRMCFPESAGTLGAVGGSNIQSSRLRGVSVLRFGGEGGREGPATADEVSFKLSAVGMLVAST